MKLEKKQFFSKKSFLWLLLILFLWFTPWVFILNFGFLIYFPYESNGIDRFIRTTGPLSSLYSKEWTPSQNIPSFCKQAVVAAEDEKFYTHNGIDLESIRSTLKSNSKHKKKQQRGASTITQQLVKNAFLSRDKNYLRKAREIEGAMILNFLLSKDLQLTWYLNIIEFGKNIYGIENAAHYYFKKEARNLSPSQCLSLALIIPSPKKWNKSLINRNFTAFFIQRYFVILNHLKNMNISNNRDLILAQKVNLWSNQNTFPEVQNSSTSNEEDDTEED